MASSSKQKSIEDGYANLSINDEDDEGLILEELSEEAGTTDLGVCLVGSFLTSRRVNFLAMQDTLAAI